MAAARERRVVRLVGILVGIYVLLRLPALYGSYRWFAELGYEGVFVTVLVASTGLFVVVALTSFAVLYGTLRVTVRNIERYEPYRPGPLPFLAVVALSIAFGVVYSGTWPVVLRFLNAVPFGVTEPVYGRDAAFYVFALPVASLAVGLLLRLIVVSAVVAGTLYALRFGVEEYATVGEVTVEAFDSVAFVNRLLRLAYDHLATVVGAALVVVSAEFVLRRWELVFSPRGAVFGAGATDLTIHRPVLGLLAVVALAGGAVAIASRGTRDPRYLAGPVLAIVVILVAGGILGAAYQGYVVDPDEFNKEATYIDREIDLTRQAFALNRIDEREFPVSDTLTAQQVEDNPGTIENIRLWDWRPLLTTYNELQIFRTYYTFDDVDIDRYMIEGRETQVMIAPREIDFGALSPESQTWVNRHLVYTHGFGVAMSPVSKVSAEGLPELFIKDIPPNSTVGIRVDQPRIYYGERTDTFALVNTRTRELDYPSGGQNVYTSYDGEGGVRLDSVLTELVYAVQFGDPGILVSDSVTADTRLQFHRDIDDRVRTIAPFLEYDEDPYIVVADGRLYWIYDAYTATDGYPYARPIRFKGERTSYLRNSVKVVIDAYSGETTYYVSDPDDPLIRTYRRIFPGLFVDLDEMPTSLRAHVRYPQDAFEVQSEVYRDYHMTDLQVFYNKEDSWRIPDEIVRGERIQMEPYYIIMKFPGEEEPEFVQIRPYIPRGKENMIGWLAARSDEPNYGRLQAFLFSKQRLVFGPMQIESRIDQDTEISQRITLWSQAGSNVIRGNLLAIPIDDTILYVEPLYLESQEAGALPELKRVIVAQGNALTMQETLERALAVRFGEAPAEGPTTPGGVTPEQLERARTLYRQAQEALRRGDFATYAERITELGEVLEAGAGNTTATG